MSQLDEALVRLETALTQLEGAAGETASSGAKPADWPREREALLARIAELEEDLRSVSSTNEEIETRLDGAMGEIRAALAH